MTSPRTGKHGRVAKSTVKGRWSEAELERLKELLSNGVPALRAAVALGRTSGAVKKQARKFGSAFLGTQEAKRRRQARKLATKVATPPGREDNAIE